MNVISSCIAVAVACAFGPSSALAQSIGAGEAVGAAAISPTVSVSVAGLSLASAQALPGFPIGAYRAGYRQGRVVLGYTIKADGTVSDVQVMEAQPVQVFTRTATKTVEAWRFAPTGSSELRLVEFRFEGE